MEIPQSLTEAVLASEAGEIAVDCGNASVKAIVTMDPDEAPTDLMLEQAAEWMKWQHDLQRDADVLIEHLTDRWPQPMPGLDVVFPPYFQQDWWFIVRFYPWANNLADAIQQGWEWAQENTPPA